MIQDYPEAITNPAPGQRLVTQDNSDDRERGQPTHPDNATV
jgi:hypothetical protein